MNTRQYQVVVWGATGFTGKWVANYLHDNYDQADLRWAIAGRNSKKLIEVSQFISDDNDQVDHLISDSADEASLRNLVRNTKVIISTVGPYAFYGSLLVKLCAEEGTHYVDLTGEVPWMAEMIATHQDTAVTSGAKIVHSCGFDSIPSDIGNFFAQQQAISKFGKPLSKVQLAVLKMKGGMSGGTLHSMMNVIKQATKDKAIRRLMFNPYSLNPDRSYQGPDGRDQAKVAFDERLDSWTAPFIMAAINTRVVRRSNALLNFKFGHDFSYTETMVTAKGVPGYLAAKSISATVTMVALLSITGAGRKILGFVLPQGKGPKVDPDNPGFYVLQFDGETNSGEKLTTKVVGDADPGYGSTSKMLSEAAVCLALDDDNIVSEGGFWTPASAMGNALMQRLQAKAGLSFEAIG